MRLHQRGVDLLVNLMDAEEHLDSMDKAELRSLLGEAIAVFGQLLERDIPDDNSPSQPVIQPRRLI